MNRSHQPTRRDMLRVAAATAALGAGSLRAQSWPNKPITLIVPFPAGGGTDAFARPLTAVLTKNLGRQVIIDNKGGAGGTVGASVDGARSTRRLHLLHGRGAPHDRAVDVRQTRLSAGERFVPVGLVSSVPQVIVVHPQRVPVKI